MVDEEVISEKAIACMDWLEEMRAQGSGGRIIGPSGVGKTYACKKYKDAYNNKIDSDTVIYISVPPKCTEIDFLAELQNYIIGYYVKKENLRDKRDDVYKLLERNEIEMIILDEADRFKVSVFEEIRDIYDKLQISIILVGTKKLETIIKKDDRIDNRFRATYQFT